MASSTVYAFGTMLGPLLGGLIVTSWGWVGLCLVIGLSMFAVGSATALLELVAKQRQFAVNLCHNDLGEECAKDTERGVDKDSSVKKSELTVQPEAQVTSLESKSLTEEPLNHWTALCKPWVTVSCLTMVASGVSSSWYLSSLESHVERLHTNEAKHNCEVCGKAYSSKSNLTAHKKIHSGRKEGNRPSNILLNTFIRRTSFRVCRLPEEIPAESSPAETRDDSQLSHPLPVSSLWQGVRSSLQPQHSHRHAQRRQVRAKLHCHLSCLISK